MKKNLFLKIHKKNPVAKSLFKKVTDRSLSSYVVARMCSVKISSKFTGEHPCLSVMSIKLLCRFIEITLCHGCSPVNLLHIFRTPFLKNTSEWLLLILLEEINAASSKYVDLQNTSKTQDEEFIVCIIKNAEKKKEMR